MYYTQPDSIAPGLSSSRFGGMDARAAMIPGGLVDGVSSLAQALLQAPMQRRQMELRAKQAQDESDYRKAQIDNMRAEQQLNQTRVQNEGDYRKGELDYRNAALKEHGRIADQENQRKGMEDLGTGIKNAWTLANQSVGSFLKGSGRGGAPTREAVISPYLEVDSPPDVYGHTHKMQRLKTPAEMDAERNARSYLKVGAKPPAAAVAPGPPAPVIAPEHRAGEAKVTQAIPDLTAQVSEYVKRARDPNDLAQLRADIAAGNVENVQARLGQMASARPPAPDPAAPPPDYSRPAYP